MSKIEGAMKPRKLSFRQNFHRNYKHFLMFAAVGIVGFFLFYFYPIIRTFILSLTDKTLYGGDSQYVGFENYMYAITQDAMFTKSIQQSLIFAVCSGVFVLITSLVLAMLLNSKVKMLGTFRTIYFLPFIIPSFAVGA
ncbi:MAG: hypothetical protein WC215_04645, partial [Bacilli bacterium]